MENFGKSRHKDRAQNKNLNKVFFSKTYFFNVCCHYSSGRDEGSIMALDDGFATTKQYDIDQE